MNKKYAIKRSATGLGMFATHEIPRNTRIIEYIGSLIKNEDVNKSNGRYIVQLDYKHAINGKQRSNLARYINHCCTPNAAAYITGKRIWIWSKKRIKAGEEITIDYGKEYYDAYIKPIGCKCKKCAKQN